MGQRRTVQELTNDSYCYGVQCKSILIHHVNTMGLGWLRFRRPCNMNAYLSIDNHKAGDDASDSVVVLKTCSGCWPCIDFIGGNRSVLRL